jgi:hypothetical protein
MADGTTKQPDKMDSKVIQKILMGDNISSDNPKVEKTWDDFVISQIDNLSKKYTKDASINKILAAWHKDATIGNKHHKGFSPHINGFYMIFMVHGTWYEDMYKSKYMGELGNPNGLSQLPKAPEGKEPFSLQNPHSYLNMLATDIDVPDMTEEYTSVSSRLRNSFVPSRNYFVSDFNISYIENSNLDIMRYHEAWFKFMELIRRGEAIGTSLADSGSDSTSCAENNKGYFLDMPFTNAVWITIFKPFTTEIQAIIKLIGVMPVTFPLKQIVGNRSQSKMTVLNMTYKAADVFYKFYNGTSDLLEDAKSGGALAKAFHEEVFSKMDEPSTKQDPKMSG